MTNVRIDARSVRTFIGGEALSSWRASDLQLHAHPDHARVGTDHVAVVAVKRMPPTFDLMAPGDVDERVARLHGVVNPLAVTSHLRVTRQQPVLRARRTGIVRA